MPDSPQYTIPEWVVSLVGRQVLTAEAQRVQDAAVVAALQDQIRQIAPPEPKLAEGNGQAAFGPITAAELAEIAED